MGEMLGILLLGLVGWAFLATTPSGGAGLAIHAPLLPPRPATAVAGASHRALGHKPPAPAHLLPVREFSSDGESHYQASCACRGCTSPGQVTTHRLPSQAGSRPRGLDYNSSTTPARRRARWNGLTHDAALLQFQLGLANTRPACTASSAITWAIRPCCPRPVLGPFPGGLPGAGDALWNDSRLGGSHRPAGRLMLRQHTEPRAF